MIDVRALLYFGIGFGASALGFFGLDEAVQPPIAPQYIIIDGVSGGDFAKELNPRNRSGRRKKEEEFLLIGRWA